MRHGKFEGWAFPFKHTYLSACSWSCRGKEKSNRWCSALNCSSTFKALIKAADYNITSSERRITVITIKLLHTVIGTSVSFGKIFVNTYAAFTYVTMFKQI